MKEEVINFLKEELSTYENLSGSTPDDVRQFANEKARHIRTLIIAVEEAIFGCNEDRMPYDDEITKCPYCGSVDIIILRVYKCLNCNHKWA